MMQAPKSSRKSSHRSSVSNQIILPQIKSLSPQAIPIVTASSWSIYDGNTGRLLWHKGGEEPREMASLTKTMTLVVCNNLLEFLNENPLSLSFIVPREAACIIGTHSGLREGDSVSVIDLFYGMMLPSGNDAALTLALGFGKLLLEKKNKLGSNSLSICLSEFVKEMNKTAASLGLKNTKFLNPHGLSHKGNKSTACDLGRIAFCALKNDLIEKIVSTQNYKAFVIAADGKKRQLIWTNTNKLLEKGFSGIKTGITPNAGPCLSSLLDKDGESIIITLLNSKSVEHRWLEAEQLGYWALNNISLVKECMEGVEANFRRRLTPLLVANLYR